ncbi:hypothetical protein BX600DRAFT_387642 [Xylariales sp. PMI_506]|nr:hypothetical protein BX600DRAFT_387642 [Xylariales sp. PMI_506]
MPELDPRRGSSVGGEASLSSSPAPRRRKIRKGTQSCWECKRRKIRCTFAKPTDATCDGCRSRRTKCISQEFHVDAAVSQNSKADRLSRMESLVEQLLKQSNTENHGTVRRGRSDVGEGAKPPPHVSPTTLNSDLDLQATGSLDEISRALLTVWPSEDDLEIILCLPTSVSILLHGIVCVPYSKYFSGQMISPRQLLKLPPPKSHPILLARRLLLLGAILQGIPLAAVGALAGLSQDYGAIMSRVVNAASRLVTSNDDLVHSLEGIECVMMESMYLNNAGNLRRAWVTNRRAMVIAQMLGLHTGMGPPSGMLLEHGTRDRIDPAYMWFRIVCSDRYLSLMLGLPQGCLDNVFSEPQVLQGCKAVEHLERIECVAAGLILQRNNADRTNVAATHKIDKLLQEGASLLPPQWWLPVTDPSVVANNEGKIFEESVRLTLQFAHNHLLIQLHLPYMMQPSSSHPEYDYSKMTATIASRAIVSQFVSFHNSDMMTAYCRGIDFIAFIASTTLCLAHIEAHSQIQDWETPGKPNGVNVLQSLQHQRLSDRGLLERTLDIMRTMADQRHDVVAQKIVSILEPLLTIEQKSSKGRPYYASASMGPGKEGPVALGKTTVDHADVLRIQIPYFGTIKIEHLVPSYLDQQAEPPQQSESDGGPSSACGMPDSHLLVPGLAADVDDWALQGVDIALFNSFIQECTD